MEHAETAERFIAATYPRAEIAVVAGSTARGVRTATSDIDLLLLGTSLFDDESQSSEAATYEFDGQIVEVFAYTPTGFEEWASRGVEQHRPVIVHMLVEGVPIRSGPALDDLRARWRRILSAGPSLGPAESAARRYAITGLLDDLRDSSDPLEQQIVASALFEQMAELMLLADDRWIATGKWLPRRLRALSRERSDLLSTPLLSGDLSTFAQRIDDELARAGGRVQAGFVR